MIAPDRIWIAPTHHSKGVDDFYLLDPKYRGNRGTEYVRADLVDELVQALGLMVYETTHLSPEESDGSHWCKISKEALDTARAALVQEGDA